MLQTAALAVTIVVGLLGIGGTVLKFSSQARHWVVRRLDPTRDNRNIYIPTMKRQSWCPAYATDNRAEFWGSTTWAITKGKDNDVVRAYWGKPRVEGSVGDWETISHPRERDQTHWVCFPFPERPAEDYETLKGTVVFIDRYNNRHKERVRLSYKPSPGESPSAHFPVKHPPPDQTSGV
jgi:hypothetical protein